MLVGLFDLLQQVILIMYKQKRKLRLHDQPYICKNAIGNWTSLDLTLVIGSARLLVSWLNTQVLPMCPPNLAIHHGWPFNMLLSMIVHFGTLEYQLHQNPST